MSAPKESLAVIGAGTLLQLGRGVLDPHRSVGELVLIAALVGLAAGGAWAFARLRGLHAFSASLGAAAYATAAAIALAPLGTLIVAALLPWVFCCAPEGGPSLGWVLAAGALLVLFGPAAEVPAPGAIDLVAVGLALALVGAAELFASGRQRELALLLLLVIVIGWLRRGPDPGFSQVFLPGRFALTLAPNGEDPLRGWLAAPVWLFALAAALSGQEGARAGVLVPAAWCCVALLLGLPGLTDLWRAAPLIGDRAPVALAPLAAFGLSWSAAWGFERVPPRSRWVALAVAVPAAVLAPTDPPPQVPRLAHDAQVRLDEAVPQQPGGRLVLTGRVEGELDPASFQLELVRGVHTWLLPVEVTRPAGGGLRFEAAPVAVDALPFGVYQIQARLRAADRPTLGEVVRPLAIFRSGDPPRTGSDLGAWVLALAVLGAPTNRRWRWVPLGVVMAQALIVAAGLWRPFLPG